MEAALHPSSLVADEVYSHENSYLDGNISASLRSVNASESHIDHYRGNSEYNDGSLQNSNTYQHQKHSRIQDDVEEPNADLPSSANFRGLSLHDKESAATKFAEDNAAVIIPDHLQVANTGFAVLSFGSFESGAFSGLLPSKSIDNNVELPVVEESEPVDQIDTRDQDYYDSAAVNLSTNENLTTLLELTRRILMYLLSHSLMFRDRKYLMILLVFNITCHQSQVMHILTQHSQMQWRPCKEITKHTLLTICRACCKQIHCTAICWGQICHLFGTWTSAYLLC